MEGFIMGGREAACQQSQKIFSQKKPRKPAKFLLFATPCFFSVMTRQGLKASKDANPAWGNAYGMQIKIWLHPRQ